jgi:hypothetical protein
MAKRGIYVLTWEVKSEENQAVAMAQVAESRSISH